MKQIAPPCMPEYQIARREGLIEPGILPLTDGLYEAGAFPLASCEGHGKSTASERLFSTDNPPYRPYVLFSAPESYARSLGKTLYENRTHYIWHITGYFHPDGLELVWTIEPNDRQLDKGNFALSIVKHDIKLLGNIAKSIKLTN